MKIVKLLWGLPGSGKSTYANEKYPNPKRSNRNIFRLDNKKLSDKSIAQECFHRFQYTDEVILDGLITTNEIADSIFSAIEKIRKDTFYASDIKYEIVFWKKDIESCLYNDNRRRSKDSKITIENLPFENPGSILIEEFNVEVTEKEVVKKPAYFKWADEFTLDRQDGILLKSYSWCVGGTIRNCYGGCSNITADEEKDFDEFDSMLTKICPNITFLQYKKLYNEVVSTDESYESDYYGGCVTYRYHVCNLEKVYNKLKEMGMI